MPQNTALAGKEAAVDSLREVPFSFDELFFSRTDDRGIILFGNSVFQRISGYEWEELLNKPHNIIRHADMPKAVFWLLWDTIKKGEPIGAYVKNRAKDGRYYWVFAVVTPVEGGYLSVRLKPGSELFAVVEKEYKALQMVEAERQLKPAESGAVLLARLKELGFRDYGDFMANALSHEIAERDAQLGKPRSRTMNLFDMLVESAKGLLVQVERVFEVYACNEYVPVNLRVQAAQLGEAGATIGVISKNYNTISSEIKSSMQDFMEKGRRVAHTIDEGMFLVGTARVQREIVEHFKQEASHADKAFQQEEIKTLQRQQRTYQQKAVDSLHEITRQAQQFQQSCLEMKRLAAGLEVTRIMGKVESAALTVSKEGLEELIEDLETFQTAISDGLQKIEQMNQEVRYAVRDLMMADSVIRQ